MRGWQLITLGLLSALPVLAFAAVGAWSLYESGRWYWVWWTLPVGWGLSALFWRLWGQRPLVRVEPATLAVHWTPRDQAAVDIVNAAQKSLQARSADELTQPQTYITLTEELALSLARHYHPNAADPLASLSVVEVVTATQLISSDVEDWFLKYVPGGHLITVGQWKLLRQAPGWYQAAANAGWVASIAMNPLNIARYVASKLAVEPLTRQLQGNLLGAFASLYVRQAGYYLIELNSGRLKGGSEHYRRLMANVSPGSLRERLASPWSSGSDSSASPTAFNSAAPNVDRSSAAAASPASSSGAAVRPTITLVVVGQVKAGKSSLINTLLQDPVAETDILPQTKTIQRIRDRQRSELADVVWLDTPGYNDAGLSEAAWQETQQALRVADVLILVIDATSPARAADVGLVQQIRAYHQSHPDLKPAPIVVVVTQVDGLSPVLEWSPPYRYRTDSSTKARSIAAAVGYAHDVFGDHAAAIVPTCTLPQPELQWNVQEELVPALVQQLQQAQAVAATRLWRRDVQRQQIHQVVDQVLNVTQKVRDWTGTSRKP
jgi:uncharacterized protein